MSHFATLVFSKENGNSVDELLAPFDENIELDPYVKFTRESAIAAVRKEIEEYKDGLYAQYLADPEGYKKKYNNKNHINYLENIFQKKLRWTDDECYEDMKKRFSESMISPNGDLLSTYNPKSKWDWYTFGGRWNGFLKTYTGASVNSGLVKKIDWDDLPCLPFAFITPAGEWRERGEMGWWACVSNEKSADVWKTEFTNFVNNMICSGEDIKVTVVDCHI